MNGIRQLLGRVLVGLGLIGLALPAAPAAVGAASDAASSKPDGASLPAKVHAVYHISWNGLDLGDFVWDSNVADGQYKLTSRANLSAFFGAYTWESVTRASGRYVQGAPQPANYRFRFAGTDKSGRIDMTFAGTSVANVAQDPPDRGSAGRIALRPTDLENVLDPLSAVMALTSPLNGKVEGTNPCLRRLAVFDGKTRFDLELSFKRKEAIAGSAKFAYVCRIRYRPIAGHKMNTETKYMAATTGIEIWLAPVASANVYVPHKVIIPTWAGAAEITSARVQIDAPRRGKIARSAN